MALLPILAFFFCSAGPFLFMVFLVKNAFMRIKHRIERDEKGCFQEVKKDVEHKF